MIQHAGLKAQVKVRIKRIDNDTHEEKKTEKVFMMNPQEVNKLWPLQMRGCNS